MNWKLLSVLKNKIWLWTAVDHFSAGLLGWVWATIVPRPLKPLWAIVGAWQCYFYVTDGWSVYPGFIPPGDQIVSKTYMTRVEGENTRLRHYLARLHRKTLCYSKSEEMLRHSIRLLLHYLKFWDVPPYLIHPVIQQRPTMNHCVVPSNLAIAFDPEALNEQFQSCSPRQVLAWCIENIRSGLVQTSAFNVSGMVIMHLLYRELRPGPAVAVLFLDTLHHFPETLALVRNAQAIMA